MHRFRLRKEDLEDCYSQATLELIAQVHRGARFVNRTHLARVLEKRFRFPHHDRRRAVTGRSSTQTALEHAAPLLATPEEGQLDIADWRPSVEQQVIARQELRAIREAVSSLSPDQRLVLGNQLEPVMDPESSARVTGGLRPSTARSPSAPAPV